MSKKIRLLTADDSAVVRRLVSESIKNCSRIEIVAAARNGREAVSLYEQHQPDVVLLDVEMPVMDGISALRELRKINRNVPVLMFSALTIRGAEATLDALSMGANDYVAKPGRAESIEQSMAYVQRELVPRILHWGSRFTGPTTQPQAVKPVAAEPARPVAAAPRRSAAPVDVIAIGSSTGGPNALATVLDGLPGDLSVPVLIVQHMPPVFTKLLAERLNRSSALTVLEAQDGMPIRPGEALIAPGGYHMTVATAGLERKVQLNQEPPENSCRPSVDALFRSVAHIYGANTQAVIMTGMGKDGLEGCRLLRQQNARILSQDEASCVVWGMPKAVCDAGLADRIVPLGDIHVELISAVRSGQRQRVLAPA